VSKGEAQARNYIADQSIRNSGRGLLKTISVYAPSAYRDEETELPRNHS
jgi:hypothetical protein